MKNYMIKQGSHSSSPRLLKMICNNTVSFDFRLHWEVWYDRKIVGDHLNKICRLSSDPFNMNRFGLGWRPSEKMGIIELWSHVDIGNKFIPEKEIEKPHIIAELKSPGLYFEAHGEIKICGASDRPGKASICVTDVYGVQHIKYRDFIDSLGPFNWLSGFYFGGNPVAPRDIVCGLNIPEYSI